MLKQVGGWTQVYKGLTFVTVRGAGHEIPLSVVEDSSTLEHNLSLDCSELVDSPSFLLGLQFEGNATYRFSHPNRRLYKTQL